MKISLNWLADFLPGSLDAEKAADALTHGGLPVEHIERAGDDTVIDVEVTSNRSDCLSHLGVARELAALLDLECRDVPPRVEAVSTPTSSAIALRVDEPLLCPHYTARIIRNVRIGPSPAWMARRLEAVGLRPINNVVDVTNYVLFELGQPLHAFDYDHLSGRQIVVRRARAGEKFSSLDAKQRELSDSMLVIADADRAVALAGVMGGQDTEVNPGTTTILLESARFAPLSVRKTARTLAMASDSSYRFERGIDPGLAQRASLRAAQLILETAGGELLDGVAEAGHADVAARPLRLRLDRLKRVLGVDLPAERIVDALRRDHLRPVPRGDEILCAIPSYRLDLNIEVDLVEEAARIIGYAQIPTNDQIAIRLAPRDPRTETMELIRSIATAAGYFEAVTFSFVSDRLALDFVPPESSEKSPLPRAEHSVRKADAQLRPSLLPGLLESIAHNESAGVADPRLFEIGSTFWNDREENLVERRRVAFCGTDDFPGVRGLVETLLGRLNPTRGARIVPDSRPGYAAGACGRVEWGGEAIGYIGQIDRAVTGKLSLRNPPVGAELDLEPLLAGRQTTPQLRSLPKFPSVHRDLSLVVPESTRYEAIEQTIRAQNPPDLDALTFVTTYRGKPLEKGFKSVTIAMEFRSLTQTLQSEAVDTAMAGILAAAGRQGWQQRV